MGTTPFILAISLLSYFYLFKNKDKEAVPIKKLGGVVKSVVNEPFD